MKKWWLLAALVTGCAHAPGTATVRVAQHPVAKADDVLVQDVRTGFKQIFVTYDREPQDQKLSYREFGHVVTRDWFQQHDTNHDGFIPLDEWLTAAELASQVADIKASGKDLVARADRNGDHLLDQQEFLAYDTFEVDATPWLAAPADAQIKPHAFQQYAGEAGLLGTDAAAFMIGDLLARGYYLDDGSDNLRP